MAGTRGLQPAFKPYAELLLNWLRGQGSYRVTSGRRSHAEQVQLYNRWLRGDPSIMTPALPGHSQHERGWAVDLADPRIPPKEDGTLFALGEWWRSVGGVWGGAADPVHFEAPRAWTGRA